MSMHSTRESGNAPGLPVTSPFGRLSRRAAMLGAVTAAGLKAHGYPHAAEAAPDAALIDLAQRLEALVGAEREAWNRHSTAEDAALAASPPAPVRRPVDYPAEAVAMETWERLRFLARLGGYNVQVMAADAEHRIALVEHARAVEAIEKRHGLANLERQASRLGDQFTAASEKLADMAATSPAGLAAKARVLIAVAGEDWMSRPAEMERHAALLASLLRDAARLGTGRLA